MAKPKRKATRASSGYSRPGIMTAIIAAMVAAAVRHSAPLQNLFGGATGKQAKAEYLKLIDEQCNSDIECKSTLMGPYNKCIASLSDKSSGSTIETAEMCFLHDSTRAAVLHGCDGNSLCVLAVNGNFERCYKSASSNIKYKTRAEGERMGKSIVTCITTAAGVSS